MSDNYLQYFNANKEVWNKRTGVHKESAFYNLEEFKNGKSSLNKIELNEEGDVRGKTLLHLQSHFGMDTLSCARAGATVTGVNIIFTSFSTIGWLPDLKPKAKMITQKLKFDDFFTSPIFIPHYGCWTIIWKN